MQITYYPELNRDVESLTFNFTNYFDAPDSIKIVAGVQEVETNDLKLLFLNDFFNFLVDTDAIVLAEEFDPSDPSIPYENPVADKGGLISGQKPDGKPGLIQLDADNKLIVAGISGGSGGDASADNQELQLDVEEEIRDRLPAALVGGRLAVDVASLTVTIDNANLEISNDVGNPIPTLDAGTAITGATIPTGGVGITGWLSGIWKLISDRFPILGSNTAANSTPVTLATDGVFSTFAGLASDAASITGSIHAKLRSSATSLQSILTALPSTVNPVLVRNISNKFRDDFAGSSLDGAVWNTIQTGAGQTITVTGSELTIASGTTINSETIIRSLTSFTIPMRVCFTFYVSQRINNQEIYLEVTDSSGNNVSRILLSSTINTTVATQTVNNSSSLSSSSLLLTAVSSTYGIVDCDLGIDQVDFYSRGTDSTLSRSTGVTKTRFLPDPNQLYYLQIRVKNLSSAPSSNTNLVIDSITVQDLEEFSVEVNGGRGAGNPSQSLPITIVSSPATVPTSIGSSIVLNTYDSFGSIFSESTTNLAAAATYTGASRNTAQSKNYIRGWVFTDQPGTLTIEQSTDSATWRVTYSLNVSASSTVASVYETKICAQYYRIKFTNTGASTQTAMQLISCTFNG